MPRRRPVPPGPSHINAERCYFTCACALWGNPQLAFLLCMQRSPSLREGGDREGDPELVSSAPLLKSAHSPSPEDLQRRHQNGVGTHASRGSDGPASPGPPTMPSDGTTGAGHAPQQQTPAATLAACVVLAGMIGSWIAMSLLLQVRCTTGCSKCSSCTPRCTRPHTAAPAVVY
jgi:hypothetical protein